MEMLSRTKILDEFEYAMKDLYNEGSIEDQDDFYTQFHEWIENEVIYPWKCKKICSDLDYDVFAIHEVWGRAENWEQAAYAALYDLLEERGLTFDELVENG